MSASVPSSHPHHRLDASANQAPNPAQSSSFPTGQHPIAPPQHTPGNPSSAAPGGHSGSSNLPKSVQNLLLENKQLKVNFDVLKKQYDKLREYHEVQLAQWRTSILEKAKEFENLRVASSTSAETLQEITQRYYEELEMRKQLEMRLDQLERTEHVNRQLRQELKGLQREREEENVRMQRDSASKSMILEQRLQRLQQKHDELVSEKTHWSHMDKEIDTLRASLDEARVRCQQLDEENVSLRRGVDSSLQERDNLILNLKRDKTTFEVKSQSLQTELQSRDRKIVSLEKAQHEMSTDCDKEIRRRKDVESKLAEVCSQLDDLKLKYNTHLQEHKRHESGQISDLKAERNQLRNLVAELRQRVDALVLQKQEIIHEHKNQESADVDKLRHELRTLHDRLQEVMDRNHQLQQEVFSKDASYKNQLHSLQSRLDSQDEKIISARLEKEKHEQHIIELKNRLSAMDHDYESTRHQLHSIESSHDELKLYTDRLRRELADTDGKYVKMQARAQRDEMEAKDLRRRVDGLTHIEQKLKTEKSFIIEQAKQKVDTLKKENKVINNKLKTEHERVEDVKRKCKKRVMFLSDQIKTLNAQVLREQSISRRAKEQAFDNEQEWKKKCFELKRVKDKYKAMLDQGKAHTWRVGTASPFGGMSGAGLSTARPFGGERSPGAIGSDTEDLYQETVRDYQNVRGATVQSQAQTHTD